MLTYVTIAIVVVALLTALGLWVTQHGWKRRDRAIRALLDGADALEAQLHDYKTRMQRLRSILTLLPSDMTAPAMANIDPDSQVKTALREVLAHRLWIKKESANATQRALDDAVAALDRSREQLARQLGLLDEVAGQLDDAGRTLRSAYLAASAALSAASRAAQSPGNPGLSSDPPTQSRH